MNAKGFYVIGKFTSCAWYATREEAEEECRRLNYVGGCFYSVEEA